MPMSSWIGVSFPKLAFKIDVVSMVFFPDNSDLNLKISTDDFCSARPLSHHGFGYIWAGARATYGATRGKVCYEVRINSNEPVELEAEETPHVLRCGWSVDETSMQLGEEPLSFGYGGTAKVSADCKFRDFGVSFGQGDVIGCFLVSPRTNENKVYDFTFEMLVF